MNDGRGHVKVSPGRSVGCCPLLRCGPIRVGCATDWMGRSDFLARRLYLFRLRLAHINQPSSGPKNHHPHRATAFFYSSTRGFGSDNFVLFANPFASVRFGAKFWPTLRVTFEVATDGQEKWRRDKRSRT